MKKLIGTTALLLALALPAGASDFCEGKENYDECKLEQGIAALKVKAFADEHGLEDLTGIEIITNEHALLLLVCKNRHDDPLDFVSIWRCVDAN